MKSFYSIIWSGYLIKIVRYKWMKSIKRNYIGKHHLKKFLSLKLTLIILAWTICRRRNKASFVKKLLLLNYHACHKSFPKNETILRYRHLYLYLNLSDFLDLLLYYSTYSLLATKTM